MKRLALLTVPVAGLLFWIGIAEMLTADPWLGSITILAALYVFILPALQLPAEPRASTASAPSADKVPSAGAFEAAPVGNRRKG